MTTALSTPQASLRFHRVFLGHAQESLPYLSRDLAETSTGFSGAVFVVVLARDIVFQNFVRDDFRLFIITGALDAADNSCLE
jgi:hypothetical protein